MVEGRRKKLSSSSFLPLDLRDRPFSDAEEIHLLAKRVRLGRTKAYTTPVARRKSMLFGEAEVYIKTQTTPTTRSPRLD